MIFNKIYLIGWWLVKPWNYLTLLFNGCNICVFLLRLSLNMFQMSWTSSYGGLRTNSLIFNWLRGRCSSSMNYSLYGILFLWCWSLILFFVASFKFIMWKLLILTWVIFLKIIKIWTSLNNLFSPILSNGLARLVFIFFLLLNSIDVLYFSCCLIFLFTSILRLKIFSH